MNKDAKEIKEPKEPKEVKDAAATGEGAAASTATAAPKKVKKRAAAEGIAHVRATFNNTLINVTSITEFVKFLYSF